jgi:hypothetical protein
MRVQILAAGVTLAASYMGYRKYAKPVIEKHSDKITLTKFYAKKLVDDGRENIRKTIAEAEDTAKRAWWFYTHPEILGVAEARANVSWLNPFYDCSAKNYHEGKKPWTWDDAPNVYYMVPDENGVLKTVEIEPVGKWITKLNPPALSPSEVKRHAKRAASS